MSLPTNLHRLGSGMLGSGRTFRALVRQLGRRMAQPLRLDQPTQASCHACTAAQSQLLQPVSKKTIRGIVFGRRRAGIIEGDILDVLASWPADKRQQALAVIEEIEEQALIDMQLMPGLVELCSTLDKASVPRGLITRNVNRSIDYFHKHHFPLPQFLPAISREAAFPYKPSPAALLHICETWGIRPHECMMVGDSAKDDVVCGNRAGATTVLLDTENRYPNVELLDPEAQPHIKVRSLLELSDVLRADFDLRPPQSTPMMSV